MRWRPGQSVSADVTVAIDQTTCTHGDLDDAREAVERLQRQPGQRLRSNLSASNLLPLGSFTIGEIGTPVGDQFVDQIYVNADEDGPGPRVRSLRRGGQRLRHECTRELRRRCKSLGPRRHSGAAGGGRSPQGDRLAGRHGLDEAGRRRDRRHGRCHGLGQRHQRRRATTSTWSRTICTAGSACHWDNGNNKIHVDAAAPPTGASLGVGFSSRTELLVRQRDGATRRLADLHQSTRLSDER